MYHFYHFKIRVGGELSRIVTQGKGFAVQTSRGDVCVFRSLALAQQSARLVACYGLLG